MRFAYIDSQGKEVGIPSVDALQLRIELGAITEETEFYDSSTDKWAPAGEHEIFKRLAREVEGSGEAGFVAPPPSVPTPSGPAPPADESGSGEEEDAEDVGAEAEAGDASVDADGAEDGTDDSDVVSPEELEPDVEPEAPEEAAEAPRPRAPDPFAMEAGPSDEPEAPDDLEPEAASGADAGGDDLGFGDLDSMDLVDDEAEDDEEAGDEADFDMEGMDSLELVDEEPVADEPVPDDEGGEPDGGDAAADDEAGFDFGEFGTLELEEQEDDRTGPEAGDGSDEPGRPEPGDISGDGGLELEESFADQHAGPGSVGDDSGMELESPLSDYSPDDDEPSWEMEEEEDASGGLELEDAAMAGYAQTGPSAGGPAAGSDDSVEGGSGGPADGGDDTADDRHPDGPGASGRGGGDGEDGAPRESTPPRARPQRRAANRTSGTGGLVLVVVALVVLGGGGWFGWQMISGGGPGSEGSGEEVVEIPDIPSELEPRMREIAAMSYSDMLDSMRAMTADYDLPEEPDQDWLAGVYLANASDYGDILRYWETWGRYLEAVRNADRGFFLDAYRAHLDETELEPEVRDTLFARAEAGFLASRRDRRLVYDQLQELIDAATSLHEFLVANEMNIDYEPTAGGISRDPVTEAVPSTQALGDEMWDRVGEIPSALDQLGTLDRVTTERVLQVFFRRLGATSIR